MHARRWLRVGLAVLDSEVKARCISCRSPSGNGKEVRRRVWRVVGVGMGRTPSRAKRKSNTGYLHMHSLE